MNKMTTILSGNFAGEGSKGNFSGYDPINERYFIHKRTMEAAGFKSDSDLKDKFPLFAIVGEKEINLLDENGEVSDKTVNRKQVLSLFTSEEKMIDAFNADAKFSIKAKVQLATTAKSSGLTEKAVEALLAAAV